MRHVPGVFPGSPSSTPGSCRFCGIGRLRDGDTGVVLTDNWIDRQGMIVLCEACAAEIGRTVPNHIAAALRDELEMAKAALYDAERKVEHLTDIIRAQRAEMALGLAAPAPVEALAPAGAEAAPRKTAAKRG